MSTTSVTVTVDIYPEDGVVGLQVDEYTKFEGWVNQLDTASVGTYPDYTDEYTVSVTVPTNPLRYRWETSTDTYTAYFVPNEVEWTDTPTDEQSDRIWLAIVQKAVRLLILPETPFGSFGEMTEFGVRTVRPDFAIKELLYGFVGQNLDVDSVTVTADDVIRVGFDDPEVFTSAREADVEAAIDAATSWVKDYLEGHGIA